MITVHYVWVGPKLSPMDSRYGFDTIGADIFSKHFPEHSVDFWCLKEAMSDFQDHFTQRNVHVRCIEDFVQEKKDQIYSEFVDHLLRRANAQLQDPEHHRYAVQEWILIKDSFFYWAAQHMNSDAIFLDSSIFVSDQNPGILGDYKDFGVSFVQGLGGYNPDPWLMRTKHNDPLAKTRFTDYFANVSRLLGTQLSETEVKPQKNRDEICNQFSLCSRGAELIPAEPVGHHGQTFLGITKIYFNSHRLSDMSRSGVAWSEHSHWLFRVLLSHDTIGLTYFMQLGPYKPETLLPFAPTSSCKQHHVSPLEWCLSICRKKCRLLKKTLIEVEQAKQVIDYQRWHEDPLSETYLNGDTGMFYKLQYDLFNTGRYPQLDPKKISNVQWQRHGHTILFGKNTIKSCHRDIRVHSLQYGCLMAFSKHSDPLTALNKCAAPTHALQAFFTTVSQRSDYGDENLFFTILSRLVNAVLAIRGDAKCDLAKATECVVTSRLLHKKPRSSHILRIIESMIQSLLTVGPLSSGTQQQYHQLLLHLVSHKYSFFSQKNTTLTKQIDEYLQLMTPKGPPAP